MHIFRGKNPIKFFFSETLAAVILCWSTFNIMCGTPTLDPRWLTLLLSEMSKEKKSAALFYEI
jgi:hypothetical protein